MDKRVRSPNYPALSLPEAIEKTAALYRNLHSHAAPREVVAKGMGYNSLNGASATAISALHKYGLLDRIGENVKVSDRALRILHPHSPSERVDAIREAAREPRLFGELAERFPGRLPSDDLLRNYLLRNGFAPGAVAAVVLAYRETVDLVEREAGGYHPSDAPQPETAPMLAAPQVHPLAATPLIVEQNQTDESLWFRYDFPGGGYVRLLSGGDVDPEYALGMVEKLLKLRRDDLAERKRMTGDTGRNANAPDEKKSEQNDDVS